MLSLSTHEPHFYIIRERIEPPKKGPSMQKALTADDEPELVKRSNEDSTPSGMQVNFTYVKICVVREFLECFMREAKLGFEFNTENIIDDFVLLCFLCGNDFLPHLPGFNIRMGGVDILLGYYKNKLPTVGGYLTTNGELNIHNFQKFLKDFSRVEFELLRRIEEVQNRNAERNQKFRAQPALPDADCSPDALFKQRLEQMEKEQNDLGGTEPLFDQMENYKQNYYQRKFGITAEDFECFLYQIKKYYIEGLIWNLRYYYQGCCSWKWFFPYYYAPLVSDLSNFDNIDFEFEMGAPFRPFEQLLSVLPPYSAPALPEPLRELMLNTDSPIIDFYPEKFVTDLKGKMFTWLGEVILPYIDDNRLLACV